jgi:hypothetical protein
MKAVGRRTAEGDRANSETWLQSLTTQNTFSVEPPFLPGYRGVRMRVDDEGEQ